MGAGWVAADRRGHVSWDDRGRRERCRAPAAAKPDAAAPAKPTSSSFEPNAQITLAIDEVPVGARDEVPTPTALQPVPRLVRFDASDPMP